MATAKQLEALAKGRAARAKKLAGKAPAKKAVKKTLKKKPATKRAATKKFIVKIVTAKNKTGYWQRGGTLDTEIKNGSQLTERVANQIAKAYFNDFKHLLNSVEVVAVKK